MRQFCELLPTVKNEFDSVEHEVKALETLGSDSTVIDKIEATSARVDVFESGVESILDQDEVRCFHLPSRL